jgi:hypothetical protein
MDERCCDLTHSICQLGGLPKLSVVGQLNYLANLTIHQNLQVGQTDNLIKMIIWQKEQFGNLTIWPICNLVNIHLAKRVIQPTRQFGQPDNLANQTIWPT